MTTRRANAIINRRIPRQSSPGYRLPEVAGNVAQRIRLAMAERSQSRRPAQAARIKRTTKPITPPATAPRLTPA